MEKIPSERQIVGISIARTEERGREVVKESIRDYLGEQFETLYRESDLILPIITGVTDMEIIARMLHRRLTV